jgi:hypothetical protein
MLPLLFMTDRKAMYFDDKELSLYETCFQPFGVEPKVTQEGPKVGGLECPSRSGRLAENKNTSRKRREPCRGTRGTSIFLLSR